MCVGKVAVSCVGAIDLGCCAEISHLCTALAVIYADRANERSNTDNPRVTCSRRVVEQFEAVSSAPRHSAPICQCSGGRLYRSGLRDLKRRQAEVRDLAPPRAARRRADKRDAERENTTRCGRAWICEKTAAFHQNPVRPVKDLPLEKSARIKEIPPPPARGPLLGCRREGDLGQRHDAALGMGRLRHDHCRTAADHSDRSENIGRHC